VLRTQVGLNGVDNGAIRFSHVRVPRVNLLDRFATVDKSGRYSSPLTSEVRICTNVCSVDSRQVAVNASGTFCVQVRGRIIVRRDSVESGV
jgi:acyl-CoA oxidase